jgi:hypothetical protein
VKVNWTGRIFLSFESKDFEQPIRNGFRKYFYVVNREMREITPAENTATFQIMRIAIFLIYSSTPNASLFHALHTEG